MNAATASKLGHAAWICVKVRRVGAMLKTSGMKRGEGLFIYLSNGFRWNCFKKNNVLFVYFWKDFIIKIARVGKNLSRDGYVYIKWGEINPWKLRYGKKSTCIELFSCARWLRETIENRVKSWQAIREAIQYSVEKVNKYFVHTVQLYIYILYSLDISCIELWIEVNRTNKGKEIHRVN